MWLRSLRNKLQFKKKTKTKKRPHECLVARPHPPPWFGMSGVATAHDSAAATVDTPETLHPAPSRHHFSSTCCVLEGVGVLGVLVGAQLSQLTLLPVMPGVVS